MNVKLHATERLVRTQPGKIEFIFEDVSEMRTNR